MPETLDRNEASIPGILAMTALTKFQYAIESTTVQLRGLHTPYAGRPVTVNGGKVLHSQLTRLLINLPLAAALLFSPWPLSITAIVLIYAKMPGLTEEPRFDTITVKELHPTFAAEIGGVNFEDISDKQFSEIQAALAKVEKSSKHFG